ncbi:MAG TPA: GNAT family N-acetyltransferase [Lacibacter sp.]|nr:GNAT family N-acetyltransferase [Lacibacter sp.]HMO87777.1 GNAT family N-acetyltransferase [Lacibacter sp.]HMP85921.1 GNAT family N-acetyltransferase [Lacibacter sp.]
MNWILKPFTALTPPELYELLRLRNEVFVVEQNCVFQDADNKDQSAWHLLGRDAAGVLQAYCRVLPPGISYREASIGRVVTATAVRNTGAGRELMREAIAACTRLFGPGTLKIGAQLYLEGFYGSFGFVRVSDVYLEDGIEHIEMQRSDGVDT